MKRKTDQLAKWILIWIWIEWWSWNKWEKFSQSIVTKVNWNIDIHVIFQELPKKYFSVKSKHRNENQRNNTMWTDLNIKACDISEVNDNSFKKLVTKVN